jgi:uncharacterized protein YbjT (DUF2867 family)
MILVTGATGTNGIELLKRLTAYRTHALPIQVRAMVRKPVDQMDHSRKVGGAEYVIADFDDQASLKRALHGVTKAFLVTNSSERAEEQQLRFVDLARAASVRHIVYLSQLHAAKESPVRFLRHHAVVEKALDASGMCYTNLRPNLFMQGLLMFAPAIAGQGRLFAPVTDARISVVDVRDIADVAAAALTQDGHQQKTYNLTGPEAITHAEMAAQLSKVLDRPVEFVEISESAMREALQEFNVPQWQIDGVIEDYAHYRLGHGATVSSAILDVSGHLPRTFAQFALDHKQQFLNGREQGLQAHEQAEI